MSKGKVIFRGGVVSEGIISGKNDIKVTAGPNLTTNADRANAVIVTAQDENFTIQSPTGGPREGQKLLIRIKDDGTGRSITYDAIFRAVGVTLPTTTVANKVLYIGCMFNSSESKWDVIAIKQEV